MMKIEDMLEFLGLDKEYGYKYLKEGLNIIKKKNLKPAQINLSAYIIPEVARKFNVSYSAVETACRRSLKRSFNKGNEEEYRILFKTNTYITLLEFFKKSRKYIISSTQQRRIK